MRPYIQVLGAAVLALAASTAYAEKWEDYSPSKEVWNVTQVKVQPSKVDDYLKTLKQTLIPNLEIEKRDGQVLDYKVLVNMNGASAGATVIIMTQFTSLAAMAPDKERDLRQRSEMRKTLPKQESEKINDTRGSYRSFIDGGTYWNVEFGK